MTTDIPESGTLGTVAAQRENRSGYVARWRTVPRELGFLLPTLPIVVVGFSVLVTLFSAGTGTLVIYVGVFVVLAALFVARGFGTLELARLRAAGGSDITRPRWDDDRAGARRGSDQAKPGQGSSGRLRAFFAPFVNGHYWLYLLHGMVVNFVVGTVTWSITIAWLATGLGGTTFWFWDRFIPQGDGDFYLSEVINAFLFPGGEMPWDGRTGDNLLNFVLGVLFLVTLPFITRGMVRLHDVIARGMLGAWRSEALERQVSELSDSRGAAISAEGHSLRRLERDIHDGPQQRLVRLQMDIASAERALDSDPDGARRLLAEAKDQSREALEELRALSRGFAPPILLDRGLVAALESLASRNVIPVGVMNAMDDGVQLAQETERNAYFVASELVTNATKHSGASDIGLNLALRRIPEHDDWWLDVTVADNGSGGATARAGHGLAGLEERLRGLGGTLEIDSPAGGPTVVTAHLPVTY